MLKMGQEGEERGKILVYQEAPPPLPLFLCLSFCDRGLMLWHREDNPFWEPLQNRLLTIPGDKKWAQLKLNQWMPSLLRDEGRKKHPCPDFYFFLFEDTSSIHFTVRCSAGWKTHAKYLFQSISPELDFTGHLLITRCGIMPPRASQSLPDKLPDSGGVRARVTSAL